MKYLKLDLLKKFPYKLFFIFLGSSLFFTLIKFPTASIEDYIKSQIQMALQNQGYELVSEESKLSFLFLPSFHMKGVVLSNGTNKVKLDDVWFKPSVFGFLLGRQGGRFWIKRLSSEISGSISQNGKNIAISLYSKEIDLRKLEFLTLFSPLSLSGILEIDSHFLFDLNDFRKLEGNANIKMKKLFLNEGSISGFKIPELSIQSGEIKLNSKSKKLNIEKINLGKAGDSIILDMKGHITLEKSLLNSNLQSTLEFQLNEKTTQSLGFITSFIQGAKNDKGVYKYKLNGPLQMPFPEPSP